MSIEETNRLLSEVLRELKEIVKVLKPKPVPEELREEGIQETRMLD